MAKKSQTQPETPQVRKGRPRKEKPAPENTSSKPTEEQYLNSDKSLPFSNTIRADLYLKLKRLEYYRKQTLRVILEEMLEEYIEKQPLADKPLPEKEVHKLKQLKSPLDYYNDKK